MTSTYPGLVARTQSFTLGLAREFAIAPDGSRVVFLRTAAGDDPSGDLWSYDVHVVAEVSTRELYRFLTRSLAAVPFGSEHQHLDLDGLLADLLDVGD